MLIPNEITQLVAGSGNNFHARVARWLRDNGWHVAISPYYMDQTQNKAREIDLIAERLWPIDDQFGRPAADLAVRLFVECKFLPAHSVFWMTDKNMSTAEALVCRDRRFDSNHSFTKKHHYLATSPTVAKLFATSGKGQEAEPFYKALNQSLNALVAMRGRPTSSAGSGQRGSSPRFVLDYPVVVCSSFDQMFSVDFFAEPAPQPITTNFQLELRYAYIDGSGAQRDDDFLLDFVEFAQIETFINAIAEDAQIAAFLASS